MGRPASIRRCLVECVITTLSGSRPKVRTIRSSGARKNILFERLRASLALRLFNHVVDNVAVLMLRAEHDYLRVSIDLHVVPRRPIELIIGADCLLLAGRIGRGELTTQHEAPMGTLTEVSFQPLE